MGCCASQVAQDERKPGNENGNFLTVRERSRTEYGLSLRSGTIHLYGENNESGVLSDLSSSRLSGSRINDHNDGEK